MSGNRQINNKMDPVAYLNQECMIQVLSFVEPVPLKEEEDDDDMQEEEEDNGNVRAAAPQQTGTLGYNASTVRVFQAHLERVSRSWRALLLEKSIEIGWLVRVDFDTMADAFEDFGIAWLRQNKVPIRSVCCGSKKKLFVLASKVLKECDTSHLSHAKIQLHLPDDSPAHFQFFRGEGTFSSQGFFQETLAKECPNLEHLDVVLTFHSNQRTLGMKEAMGKGLFSHANITSLSIQVQKAPSVEGGDFYVDFTMLEAVIQQLPSLRSLIVTSNKEKVALFDGNQTGPGPVAGHISSSSLQFLHVDGFSDGIAGSRTVSLSLDCPRLQQLWLTAMLWSVVAGRRQVVPGPAVPGFPFRLARATQKIVSAVVPDRCIVHVKDQLGIKPIEQIPFVHWRTLAGVQ